MSSDPFWAAVEAQLAELKRATSATDVVRILAPHRNPYGPDHATAGVGFFAGSGGDEGLADALDEAKWVTVWWEADYHFCMRARDGSMITYVEGDIYVGDTRHPSTP